MLRLLVVDDERLYCSNLERSLTARGFLVRTAFSGATGVEVGLRFDPHVLVTDWIFGDDLVGSDVRDRLRSANPRLRSILISGFLGAPDGPPRDDFDEVIAKPFRMEELLAAIDRVTGSEGRFMTDATVFVVDDDPQMRESVSLMLRSVGYEPRPYASAEDFLEDLSEVRTPGGPPRCVLIDVRMPGMSGLELQQRLIAEDVRIPAVILTGYAEVPMAVQALQDGAVHFLEKPIRRDMLQRCVEDALAVDEQARVARAEETELAKRLESLTAREREVLDRLLDAKNVKQIAAELGIGLQTIAKHRAKVLRKFGARNDVELALLVAPHRAPENADRL
ncbi:MAG: response regulator [Planctomycetaceae bacterium]